VYTSWRDSQQNINKQASNKEQKTTKEKKMKTASTTKLEKKQYD